MRAQKLIWAGLVAVCLGCETTGSLGGSPPIGTEDGGRPPETTSAMPPGTTTLPTSTASGTDAGSGVEPPQGTGTGTSDGGSSTFFGTGTSTGTGYGSSGNGDTELLPPVCEVPGKSCLACLGKACCDVLFSCAESPFCSCVVGCLQFAPDFFSCVDSPACSGGPKNVELGMCAVEQCGPSCGVPGSHF